MAEFVYPGILQSFKELLGKMRELKNKSTVLCETESEMKDFGLAWRGRG